MILTVRHVTTYSYERPMRQLVQSLRLYPSLCDSQTVLDWDVSVEGFADSAPPIRGAGEGLSQQGDAAQMGDAPHPTQGGMAQGRGADALGAMAQSRGADAKGGMAQSLGGMSQSLGSGGRGAAQKLYTRGLNAGVGAAFRDGAGDRVETVSIRGPVSRVVISVQGRVETRDTSGILRSHRETAVPGLYLRSTRATDADAGLADLARDVMARAQGQSRLALAHALASEVSDRIIYSPGETEAGTTAAEALSRGKGVCQDHAHALISVAHQAGIPARYVVGYLATEAAMVEASHAWAELFLDGFGWIGFDPANRCCPDETYLRLCSGYDASDAAPIRGIATGAQPEHLSVDVAVRRAEA